MRNDRMFIASAIVLPGLLTASAKAAFACGTADDMHWPPTGATSVRHSF